MRVIIPTVSVQKVRKLWVFLFLPEYSLYFILVSSHIVTLARCGALFLLWGNFRVKKYSLLYGVFSLSAWLEKYTLIFSFGVSSHIVTLARCGALCFLWGTFMVKIQSPDMGVFSALCGLGQLLRKATQNS